jgi:hypothetical protein
MTMIAKIQMSIGRTNKKEMIMDKNQNMFGGTLEKHPGHLTNVEFDREMLAFENIKEAGIKASLHINQHNKKSVEFRREEQRKRNIQMSIGRISNEKMMKEEDHLFWENKGKTVEDIFYY